MYTPCAPLCWEIQKSINILCKQPRIYCSFALDPGFIAPAQLAHMRSSSGVPVILLLLSCRHVGGVDTDHHNVVLKVKSVLDACGDGSPEEQVEEEGMGSQQVGP